MATWSKIVHGVMIAATVGALGFMFSQSADTAATPTWRVAIEYRLNRMEDKLDRLIEGRR